MTTDILSPQAMTPPFLVAPSLDLLPPLFGFSGYAGAGKDAVCRILREFYPGFKRIAFADALKREVSQHYGISLRGIEKHKPAWRSILQEWGQGKREADPFYWINQVRDNLPPLAAIPDVRYKNEREWIESAGGVMWRIERTACKPALNHISELDLNDTEFMYTIYNDGTLDDLKSAVLQTLTSMAVAKTMGITSAGCIAGIQSQC